MSNKNTYWFTVKHMGVPENTWVSRKQPSQRQYIFFAYYFFGVALEVPPGSLEFFFKNERAERAHALQI